MYVNEFEAIYMNREMVSDLDRRQTWRLEESRTEEAGIRRRFDAFIAGFARLTETRRPTEASDLL